MIKRVSIEKLRGIASGSLDDLAAVNVIVGPNNSGKSTILDALLLAASKHPEKLAEEVAARRQLNDAAAWLLHRSKGERADESALSVITSDGIERRVTVRNRERKGQQRMQFVVKAAWPQDEEKVAAIQKEIDAIADDPIMYGKLQTMQQKLMEQKNETAIRQQQGNPVPGTSEVRLIESELTANEVPLSDLITLTTMKGLKDEAKQIILELVPEIQDVSIGTQSGSVIVNLEYGADGALPVDVAGDGVRLLLRLSYQLTSQQGGLVLLEEPETHLHPAAILQAARAIRAASRRGIQLVLTTHSLDLIDSLLHAFSDDLDSLAFFRVKLDHGKLVSHRLAGSSAADARTRIAEDLR